MLAHLRLALLGPVLLLAACSGRPGRGGDDEAETGADAAVEPEPEPEPEPAPEPDPAREPAPDAGDIPEPSTGIACSNVTCEPVSERCCIETAIHHECRPRRFDCPFEWANRECDGPEDCSEGQACCFDAIDARGPAQCRGDCLEAQIELCHGPEDCRSEGAACCFPPGRPAGFCRAEDWPAVECLP